MKKYNKIILCLLPMMLLASCGTDIVKVETLKLNKVENNIEFLKNNNSKDISDSVRNLKFDDTSKFYENASKLSELTNSNDNFLAIFDEATKKYGIVSAATSKEIIKPTLEEKDIEWLEECECFLIHYLDGDKVKIYDNLGNVLYEGKTARCYIFRSIKNELCFEIRDKKDFNNLILTGLIKNEIPIKDEEITVRRRNYFDFDDLASCGLDGYTLDVDEEKNYIISKDGKVVNKYNVGEHYFRETVTYLRMLRLDGYEIVQINPELSGEKGESYILKLDLLTGKKIKYKNPNIELNQGEKHFRDENGVYKYATALIKDGNKPLKKVVVDKDFNIYKELQPYTFYFKDGDILKIDDKYIFERFPREVFDSKLNSIHSCKDSDKLIFNPTINLDYKNGFGEGDSLYDYEGNLYRDISFKVVGTFVGTKSLWYMDKNNLNILHDIDPDTHIPSNEETIGDFEFIDKTNAFALFKNTENEKFILTPDYELTHLEGLKDYTFYKLIKRRNGSALLEFKEGIYNLKLK